MKLKFSILFLIFSLASCGGSDNTDEDVPIANIDDIAKDYIFIELSMGLHDSGHVDAYFGPEEIRDIAAESALTLDEIDFRAEAMISLLNEWQDHDGDALLAARVEGLRHRLTALRTRIALRQDRSLPFDEESLQLFGARAPNHDNEHFAAILEKIDALLPGDGPLPQRVNEFRSQFEIPPDRLSAVFEAAIEECRRRTLAHIGLPENESFTIEYVNDKPWSGYNWYQGGAQSLIQVNTDLPTQIDRAVDLGCHEGYPGHHTFNVLLEKNLVDDKGWMEFTLYPLFSPQSLIAEGSGNYGIELAFPDDERIDFEKDVLFPLAGLDPAAADDYYRLVQLLAQLNYAGNEAARDYLNGDINREQTEQWLTEYALSSPERAKQRVDFFETYRSYVINYNLGKDMVRRYIEQAGDDQDARWQRFEQLLSSPMLPADLE